MRYLHQSQSMCGWDRPPTAMRPVWNWPQREETEDLKPQIGCLLQMPLGKCARPTWDVH